MLWALPALVLAAARAMAAQAPMVTRATLDNGLRVVIVRDTLAPVVSVQMNYLVGSDQTPKGFPGTAHAVEHMMFRGSPGLTADQLAAISANMGGAFDAETSFSTTKYFFVVPSQDLDVALHIAAIRMRAVDMAQHQWQLERGAIEQEVAHDLSNPNWKFVTQLFARLFAGTPYAHTPLGTRPSFNETSAALLKRFHDEWYTPNDAILVIAGDVDPRATLAEVKALFASIARRALPKRQPFQLGNDEINALDLLAVGDFPPQVGECHLYGSKRVAQLVGDAGCDFADRGKPFSAGKVALLLKQGLARGPHFLLERLLARIARLLKACQAADQLVVVVKQRPEHGFDAVHWRGAVVLLRQHRHQ